MPDARPAATPARNPQSDASRFRALLASTAGFVAVLDADGLLLEASASALALIGAPRDEAVGTVFWDGSWWRDDDGSRARLARAAARAAAGATVAYEADVRTADDALATLELQFAPIGAAEDVREVLVQGHVIRADEQADRERDRLFEMSVDLMTVATSDGYLRRVNDAWTRVLGYSREDLLSRPFLDFVHPDDVEATIREMRRLDEGEPVLRFRNRYRHADGSTRWISWTSGAQPERGLYYASGRDITRRVEAERELDSSRERLAATLSSSLDGIMVFRSVRDADGAIVDFAWVEANPASEAITGRPPSTLIGRRLLEEMPGNREAGLFDAYVHVVETGEPFRHELHYDDGAIDSRLTLTAVRVGDGFAVTFRDVTQMEEARSLIDSLAAAETGTWHVDPAAGTVRASETTRRFFGLPEERANRLDAFLERVHDDDREALQDALASDSGEAVRAEFRVLHDAGEHRWLVLSGAHLAGRDARHVGILSDITATRLAERTRDAHAAALEALSTRLDTALTAANVGTWHVDLATGIDTRDARLNAILGLPAEESTTHVSDFFGRIHADDQPMADRRWKEALAGADVYETTLRIVRDSGEERWIRDRGVIHRDADGTPRMATGAVVDVTEERAGEEERERLAALVASSEDAVLRKSPEGIVTDWNPAAERIYGYSAEEMIGSSIERIVPQSHIDDMHSVHAAVLQGASVRSHETKRVTRDGRVLDVSLSIAPIRDADGRIVALGAIERDVTELRAAAERLARLAAIVETTSDFVGSSTVDRRAIFVNRAGRRLAGVPLDVPAEELSVGDFYPPETLRILEQEAFPQAEAHGLWQGETELKTRDGRRVPLSQVLIAHRDDAGQVTHFSTIARDITDQRAAAQMQAQLNEELERRVAARTAELERSNADLDQFAYVASHDLKAPLRAIDMLTSWIYEDVGDELPATARRHVDKIRQRVGRMERLLEDMLVYSRVGREKNDPETVDLRALLIELTDTIAPSTSLGFEIAPDLPVVETLRVPLEMVVRNLIDNAVKHHDSQSGCISVGTAPAPEGFVGLYVSDDGPGIDSAYHDRIFRMFSTLQPRDAVEGSGMGLAIVKKAVESQGGRLDLDSGPGRGTRFTFTWPATQPPA